MAHSLIFLGKQSFYLCVTFTEKILVQKLHAFTITRFCQIGSILNEFKVI